MPDVAMPSYERLINGQRIQAGSHRGRRFVHAVRAPHPDPKRGEGGAQIVHDFTQSEPDEIVSRLLGEVRCVPFDPYPPDALRTEIARLESAGFPELAADYNKRMRIPLRDRLGPMPVGNVLIDVASMIPHDEVRDMLKRHSNGDFGTIGQLADASLDDDMRWAPECFDVLTRNAVSMERGEGLVLSEYQRTDGRIRIQGLRLITVLGMRNQTVVWSDRSSINIG